MTDIPYERMSGVAAPATAREADRILEEGWTRRGYPAICLNDRIPWELSTTDERSWNFHLHCWDMVDPLLQAHSSIGGNRYLEVALRIALEWESIHSDPHDSHISPFAWYDMAVGLRAYRLAYLLDAAKDDRFLTPEAENRLWKSLNVHRKHLEQDEHIAFHSNHGFYQVAGQLAMARRYSHVSEAMHQSQKQGLDRLSHMIEMQFASDGVHREHSPDYHRMVYQTLKALMDNGLVEDEELQERALKIERALAWFVRPDGYITNFGDSDHRLMTCSPEQARKKWATEEMRFVVTDGEIGAPPPARMAVFEEGGYFVVRDSHSGSDRPKGNSYLAQTAAFHSRTHKHADDLSFVWYDRGQELMVDAGRYGYIGKTDPSSELSKQGYWYADPNRIYCETTRAHNTLEFDNTDYPRRGVKPYGSALTRHIVQDGMYVCESETKQFGSIRHARVLIYKPAQWLIVFDWFHDNTYRTHDVRQWFHLAHGLAIESDSMGFLIPLVEDNTSLRVASLLPGARRMEPTFGQKVPCKQGWWSPKERELLANFAFGYEMDGQRNGCFATLFSFSREIEPNVAWARAPKSGRKLRVGWLDDAGVHRLWLNRPKTGGLSVSRKDYG